MNPGFASSIDAHRIDGDVDGRFGGDPRFDRRRVVLTESSFAGNTTSTPMVLAAIVTAIKPNGARGVEAR